MARKMVLVPQSFLEEMQQSREKDILSLPHPLPYPPEVTAAVKAGQTLDTLNQPGSTGCFVWTRTASVPDLFT